MIRADGNGPDRLPRDGFHCLNWVPMDDFTPRQVVKALDRYIIGQDDAKRAVAIAIRNRWRRLRVNHAIRDDIAPKTIRIPGPTVLPPHSRHRYSVDRSKRRSELWLKRQV